MTSETRCFRKDTHTINGLFAHKLLTSQSTGLGWGAQSYMGDLTAYFGIRVFVRHSGGSEDELTNGTPVAVVSRFADGEGYQSNIWTPPKTSLQSDDAIRVNVYYRFTGTSWTFMNVWITNQVANWDMCNQLDAATWTIYYYTYRYYDSKLNMTSSWFYYGISTHNSRIENFTWSYVAPLAVGYGYSDGLVSVQVGG